MSTGLTNTTAINSARKLWQIRVWLLVTYGLAYPVRWMWRVLHARMGADPERFKERLGRPSGSSKQPVIWLHAASLGEVAQIGSLVRHFTRSGRQVLVTTTSQAGADWVQQELPGLRHQFAPIDTAKAVGRFLLAWDIRAAIFVEGDFGPRLTLAIQARGVPMVLLNARHSRTRARFPKVFGALLGGFSLVTCRSEAVARSIRALGVPRNRVEVLPDLRIAAEKLPCPATLLNDINAQVGTRQVWLAASTHPSDEEAVLAAHEHVLQHRPDGLLIIAPRHPKRGAPIETAARARGLHVSRRSIQGSVTPDVQLYIADTLGELGVFLAIAPVTFLGGSFGTEGGHNPYEPASFGSAILSGSGVANFADAFDTLSQIGAAEIIQEPAELGPRLVALMQGGKVQTMGEQGKRFMAASETSLPATIALLERALEV